MSVGLGGCGFVGIALETTSGTYVAPTKYLPIRNESLKHQQETVFRRPIRQTVDVTNAIPGNVHVEGDIEIEVTPDSAVWFHHISRAALVKTGAGPYSYVYKNNCAATATASGKTASITVVRNGIVFAYTGCVVSSFKYSMDNGAIIGSYSIVGSDEAVQSAPTPTWPTTVPYGAGETAIQIPTATAIFDADGFEFNVSDNAEPQFRTKATGRGAQFIKFGERATTLSIERDFESRTDYDAYKALTAQGITIVATKGLEIMTILLNAAIKESYEVGLSGQGDLIRAQINYQGIINGSGDAYTLTFATAENIV